MPRAFRGSAFFLVGRHSYEEPSFSGEAVSQDRCLPQNCWPFRHTIDLTGALWRGSVILSLSCSLLNR